MVARLAGAHNVGPRVLPAFATGQHVIDCHIPGRRTAVLAGVVITGEDLVAGHLSARYRTLDHVDEPDHVGPFENVGDRVDVLPAVLHRLRLALADELHRPANVADVQRLVVLIEHQYRCPRGLAHRL